MWRLRIQSSSVQINMYTSCCRRDPCQVLAIFLSCHLLSWSCEQDSLTGVRVSVPLLEDLLFMQCFVRTPFACKYFPRGAFFWRLKLSNYILVYFVMGLSFISYVETWCWILGILFKLTGFSSSTKFVFRTGRCSMSGQRWVFFL